MTVRSDNRLADAPMVPVSCRHCGASVLARKSSWQQTSVQWNAEAAATCPQRRQAACIDAQHGGVFLACSALRDSIAAAVQEGALHIVDEDFAETEPM